jgi:hypothetical protein
MTTLYSTIKMKHEKRRKSKGIHVPQDEINSAFSMFAAMEHDETRVYSRACRKEKCENVRMV